MARAAREGRWFTEEEAAGPARSGTTPAENLAAPVGRGRRRPATAIAAGCAGLNGAAALAAGASAGGGAAATAAASSLPGYVTQQAAGSTTASARAATASAGRRTGYQSAQKSSIVLG